MKLKFILPAGFRRLKWNEVVNAGDFVVNAKQEMELWEGLHGFFADTYVNPVYRATDGVPAAKPQQIGFAV